MNMANPNYSQLAAHLAPFTVRWAAASCSHLIKMRVTAKPAVGSPEGMPT